MAKIRYTCFDSPVGTVYAGALNEKLIKISICGDDDGAEFHRWLMTNFPKAEIIDDIGEGFPLDEARRQIMQYLKGSRDYFDLPFEMTGTDFQKKVYCRMLKIPRGKTVSYGGLAGEIGSPGGARAVGGACHSNPLPLIVPCHRVIGADGTMTGFGGGIPLKEKLLQLERGFNG